jgi:hypothetical protein
VPSPGTGDELTPLADPDPLMVLAWPVGTPSPALAGTLVIALAYGSVGLRDLRSQLFRCLAGLLGPGVGDLLWRLPSVFGYGVVFPLACLMIGSVFKNAAASLGSEDQYAVVREPRTAVWHN